MIWADRGVKVAVAVAACLVLSLTGCGNSAPGPEVPATSTPVAGDPGEWKLLDPSEVTAETTTLHLGVSRAGCAGGVTGEVLAPKVAFEAGRITIQADVAPLPEGAYTCQSNDFVPITVELAEPVGDRELFDALCLDTVRLTHSYCMDGGVRWRP